MGWATHGSRRQNEQKATLWAKANALYAGYDGYQARAGDREIRVVICAPRD